VVLHIYQNKLLLHKLTGENRSLLLVAVDMTYISTAKQSNFSLLAKVRKFGPHWKTLTRQAGQKYWIFQATHVHYKLTPEMQGSQWVFEVLPTWLPSHQNEDCVLVIANEGLRIQFTFLANYLTLSLQTAYAMRVPSLWQHTSDCDTVCVWFKTFKIWYILVQCMKF
jgi:hypothetical protein